MGNLDNQCALVQSGTIDFNEFVVRTRTEFARLANSLVRRWPPSTATAIEDVIQELVIGAWIKFIEGDYNPARGDSLARYIVFNAMSHAKRKLHKDRNAKLSGSADRNPSRIERPLSSYGSEADAGDRLLEQLVTEELGAEQIMIDAQTRDEALTRALHACTSPDERLAIIAIQQGGDVDGAARVLYDDIDVRIALRLCSVERAERYVMRGAECVVRRLSGDASAS